jgi:hypothetical protein
MTETLKEALCSSWEPKGKMNNDDDDDDAALLQLDN